MAVQRLRHPEHRRLTAERSPAPDLDRFLVAYEDGTLLGRQLRDVMLTPRCAVADGIAMG